MIAPVLWMSGAFLLAHPLYCNDVKTRRYTVQFPEQAQDSSLPRQLHIVSQYPLSVESQRFLLDQYRVAASVAPAFARSEGIAFQRSQMPNRLVLCESPQALGEVTGLPVKQYGGKVVARVDLNCGIVYLGRRDPSDLYVELGKWFFYDRSLRWGNNRAEDLRRLGLAERFALRCQQTKVKVATLK